MPTIDENDGRLALIAPGVRLVFRQAGDRWTHAIEADRDDGSPVVLAASIEGEADPSRVVSPAYQEVHAHRPPDDPGAVQALLVGRSGPHHTSAVFTLRAPPEGGALIRVEVADRCRSPVVALASTYAVDLPAGHLRAADPAAVRWDLAPLRAGSLAIEAVPPTRIDLREDGRRGVQVQAAAQVQAGEATFVWSYTWTLRGAS